MRFITPAIYASILGVAIYFAIVQSPLPPAVASAPSGITKLAAPSGDASSAVRTGKRESCRQQVSSKKLRRGEARDQMQLCIAKARLDCLQQAIDMKYRGPARRVYVKSCVAA